MTYAAPTTEIRFVLDHVARLGELAAHDRFAAATPDMVDAIVEGVGQFAAEVYAPLNPVGDRNPPRWEQGRVIMPPGFREAYAQFVEAGWGTIDAPVDYGGQGLPFCLANAVIEALGSGNMGFTLINILTPGAIHALMAYGSDEQKATWLPRLVTGEWNGTMNLTEPQAGSDVGALRTMAEPVEDGPNAGLWRLRGQKIYITFGEHDLTDNIVHLVLARTPGAPAGTKGISLFLVPKYRLDADGRPAQANGVHCVSIEHKLGIHASPTCTMSFGEDAECLGELVGAVGGGMRAMFVMMNAARMLVGNQGVQIAERALQAAEAYAHGRVQGQAAGSDDPAPVAIVHHPDVRRMLWWMKAQTEAIRALVYYAAGQADFGKLGDADAALRAEILTPLAKAHGTDIGCQVASMGIQVHGGMGFVEETGVAQYYRDARINPIYEGTNGIQAADLVGRKLAMAGGAGVDALIADIAADAPAGSPLAALAAELADAAAWLRAASIEDRLAGSYPFLTMLSVATCGWLMSREAAALDGLTDADPRFVADKRVTTRFYAERIVPEALGLAAAVRAGAAAIPPLAA